jgi:hypothetical protein
LLPEKDRGSAQATDADCDEKGDGGGEDRRDDSDDDVHEPSHDTVSRVFVSE